MSLTNKSIGFIGFGKMGKAIAKGLSSHGFTIYAYAPHKENVPAEYYQEYSELVKKSDILILAAKPQHICTNITQALPFLTEKKILVSIAAGVDISSMQEAAQGKSPIVRTMPNLPASIGKGVFALCFDDNLLKAEDKAVTKELFNLIGTSLILAEEEIDAFSGLVGCGPGFVFHLMEAFYEAGVTMGFSHKDARELTAQTFLGTAELAAQEEISFYDLKQQVCSPKGITIKGVNHLEKEAVKASLLDAILIASKKK